MEHDIGEFVPSKEEHAMASKEEVPDILQSMKDDGNYVATTPLLTMKCNQGGLSSSLEDCLDNEDISHGHAINKEDVVGSRSNSITPCADMIHIMKIAQVLTTLGGELRHGRNPTTAGAHKVKDVVAKGNYLLQVANIIENTTPKTPHPLPSIATGHDIMNPMLYPESLEVVAKAFQQGSLGKENMSQLVHFLHLLGGDLLDITT